MCLNKWTDPDRSTLPGFRESRSLLYAAWSHAKRSQLRMTHTVLESLEDCLERRGSTDGVFLSICHSQDQFLRFPLNFPWKSWSWDQSYTCYWKFRAQLPCPSLFALVLKGARSFPSGHWSWFVTAVTPPCPLFFFFFGWYVVCSGKDYCSYAAVAMLVSHFINKIWINS